jgi:aryl-alcohol dehydrogenase-like predicted oxidoreductase
VPLTLRPLGRSGVLVSEFCLGALTFGRESDERTSGELLDIYLAEGGNLIDTADVYGDSEILLGRLLRSRRDDVLLASKAGLPYGADGGPNELGASRHHLRNRVERSLRRLGTDHLDLYQVHCWDPLTPLEQTLSTLDDLVRAGTVRYVGVSNFTGWQVAKAMGVARLGGWAPLVSVSPQYSLSERGAERDLLPACLDESLAVLPYSPLGGGLLSGKYLDQDTPPDESRGARLSASTASLRRRLGDERHRTVGAAVREVAAAIGRTPAQVALNWVLHRPGVTAPLLGARTPEQLRENLGAAGWQLETTHRLQLDEASAIELGYPHDWLEHYGIRQGAKPDREVTGVA